MMPHIRTTLEYLQDLELYKSEKPYFCLMPAHAGIDDDEERLDNLEFESYDGILIEDMRELDTRFQLGESGFEILDHTSEIPGFKSVDTINSTKALDDYRLETETLLTRSLGASYVKCYDIVLRKNILFDRTEFDIKDPFHTEGPAQGAHNDITYNSGPVVINRYLSDEEKLLFLRPGYRFRIVNTWRSLLPILEDRPLAVCDSRSVASSDLIACDRIIPDRVGEVYYLKHSPQHKWYWLSNQTPSDLYAFVMYDTKAGSHARFCPHVSFPNPQARIGAPPRQSVETRSVVITRE